MPSPWKYATVSVTGTKHQAQGLDCDDNSAALWDEETQTLILAAADGAGESSQGGVGSSTAIKAVLDLMPALLQDNDFEDTKESLEILLFKVAEKARVLVEAQVMHNSVSNIEASVMEDILAEKSVDFSDFSLKLGLTSHSTTLLIVTLTPKHFAALQVGDGFIIATSYNQKMFKLFNPQKGKFANETFFLTSCKTFKELKENGHIQVHTSAVNEVGAVALITDGLEYAAMHMGVKEPQPSFFLPLFRSLSEAKRFEFEQYLKEYLEKDKNLNEITNDDKTVVLAVNIQSLPELQDSFYSLPVPITTPSTSEPTEPRQPAKEVRVPTKQVSGKQDEVITPKAESKPNENKTPKAGKKIVSLQTNTPAETKQTTPADWENLLQTTVDGSPIASKKRKEKRKLSKKTKSPSSGNSRKVLFRLGAIALIVVSTIFLTNTLRYRLPHLSLSSLPRILRGQNIFKTPKQDPPQSSSAQENTQFPTDPLLQVVLLWEMDLYPKLTLQFEFGDPPPISVPPANNGSTQYVTPYENISPLTFDTPPPTTVPEASNANTFTSPSHETSSGIPVSDDVSDTSNGTTPSTPEAPATPTQAPDGTSPPTSTPADTSQPTVPTQAPDGTSPPTSTPADTSPPTSTPTDTSQPTVVPESTPLPPTTITPSNTNSEAPQFEGTVAEEEIIENDVEEISSPSFTIEGNICFANLQGKCQADVRAQFIEQLSFIVILKKDSVEIARQEVKQNGYKFNSSEIVLEAGEYNLVLDDSSFAGEYSDYKLNGNNYTIKLQPDRSTGITFLYQPSQ